MTPTFCFAKAARVPRGTLCRTKGGRPHAYKSVSPPQADVSVRYGRVYCFRVS